MTSRVGVWVSLCAVPPDISGFKKFNELSPSKANKVIGDWSFRKKNSVVLPLWKQLRTFTHTHTHPERADVEFRHGAAALMLCLHLLRNLNRWICRLLLRPLTKLIAADSRSGLTVMLLCFLMRCVTCKNTIRRDILSTCGLFLISKTWDFCLFLFQAQKLKSNSTVDGVLCVVGGSFYLFVCLFLVNLV